MIENRRSARVTTNQAVTVTTVLSCEEATIVDLSETGAQIRGASHPRNTRICIDAGDESVYATVMWSEIDRMGVAFLHPLQNGHLKALAIQARSASKLRLGADADMTPMSMQHRAPATFGRRAA